MDELVDYYEEAEMMVVVESVRVSCQFEQLECH
jgi:hypothetical protein